MKTLILLTLPFAEVYVTLFVVGKLLGWWLLVWLIVAFMIGGRLLRRAALVLMPHMQGGKLQGDPSQEMLRSMSLAFAGLLLILPGVLTDALALLLLLPPVQQAIGGAMAGAMAKRNQGFVFMSGFPGQSGAGRPFGDSPFGGGPFGQDPFGQGRSQVFDGEARDITPEEDRPKRIDAKPANDE